MRHDVARAVPIIDFGLKDNHSLPGDLRPSEPADELLGLAAEHAAADHLDPAGGRRHIMKSDGFHFFYASGAAYPEKGGGAGRLTCASGSFLYGSQEQHRFRRKDHG